jgi:copper oxidase (laccase) domain-containing protein
MHPDHLGPLPFFRFDVLSGQKNLLHGISTRRGGVSAPPYHWLNLGFGTEEDRIVEENYRIVLKALRLDPNLLIASKQVHGNEVLVMPSSAQPRGLSSWYGSPIVCPYCFSIRPER